jgi:type II secretory pathway component PulF
MPVYKYRAATKQGDVVENRVEVANKFILLKKLKQSELLPISITSINVKSNKKINKQKRNLETSNSVLKQVRAEQIRKNMDGKEDSLFKKANAFLNKGKKITKKDIKVFTQNFFLLKKANFNNIHALSTVLETIENPTLKAIVEDILLGVEAGENIYTTMEYYSSVFPPIYVNMIKVGEMSGALTNALEQAVNYLEETEAMNRKLKSILVPNIIQFVGLFVLLIVGTIVAMPMLQGVLDQFGSKDQLPEMTIKFSNFLDFIISIWYVPVGIIVAVTAVIIWYVHTPKGKYNFHLFKYKMPVFGKLIYAIDFSRLCQSILLNLKNGMRIQDALETGKNVSNNLVMLSIIESAINNTVTGQSWIEPFEESGLSTPMITEMLKIGMQTDLTEMMEKLVAYMQIDIDEIMQRIIKILPQIVYLIVGVMLIFVVIVVLVPMINMYMGGWMFSAFDI